MKIVDYFRLAVIRHTATRVAKTHAAITDIDELFTHFPEEVPTYWVDAKALALARIGRYDSRAESRAARWGLLREYEATISEAYRLAVERAAGEWG